MSMTMIPCWFRLERAILKVVNDFLAGLENPKRKILRGQDIDRGTIPFSDVLFDQPYTLLLCLASIWPGYARGPSARSRGIDRLRSRSGVGLDATQSQQTAKVPQKSSRRDKWFSSVSIAKRLFKEFNLVVGCLD